MFVYVCVLISNSLQIHIGIETRIFLTLWKLIYIPPALPGRCVFLCDMPCCPHQRIHTVQRNQTESWSRKHHFKLSLSSQSTKLMLAGLEDALLSPFPISLHNLLPCNSPPSVPHMQFCIHQAWFPYARAIYGERWRKCLANHLGSGWEWPDINNWPQATQCWYPSFFLGQVTH